LGWLFPLFSAVLLAEPHRSASAGGPMQDLAYIGLTILVFAVLYLIVKGVEHFER
jgi:hypothetical protein